MHLSPLRDVITDTHFVERNRFGRHFVFMARVLSDLNPRAVRGIGIDRDVAVCFELDGKACVYNQNGGKSYFFSVNDVNSKPEVFEKGESITWNNSQRAIESHEISGNQDGSKCFDVNQWIDINEASSLSYYYIIDGLVFNKKF